MDHRPIGVFDSGLGGLTAVMALRRLMPDESIVYFGDTARMPYGVRSAGELRIMARQDMELLERHGVKAILAACGTVSSTVRDVLNSFPLPVFNVVDAPVEAMAAVPGDAPLGIIATDTSIKSGVFAAKLSKLCPGREIIPLPCQDFVKLIESGHTKAEDELVRECVERSLAPLKGRGIASLLLGCTHFGFLSDAIGQYLGRDVRLVSASECAAGKVAEYIGSHSLNGSGGQISFLTSGDRQIFVELSSALLGEDTDASTAHIAPMEV